MRAWYCPADRCSSYGKSGSEGNAAEVRHGGHECAGHTLRVARRPVFRGPAGRRSPGEFTTEFKLRMTRGGGMSSPGSRSGCRCSGIASNRPAAPLELQDGSPVRDVKRSALPAGVAAEPAPDGRLALGAGAQAVARAEAVGVTEHAANQITSGTSRACRVRPGPGPGPGWVARNFQTRCMPAPATPRPLGPPWKACSYPRRRGPRLQDGPLRPVAVKELRRVKGAVKLQPQQPGQPCTRPLRPGQRATR